MARARLHPETWNEGQPVKKGDLVTVCMYSDRSVYEVVGVSKTGKKLTLHPVKATLLNGFKSGEPDALVSHPGGFAHHVTGMQRYSYERLEKDPARMSFAFWSRKQSTYRRGINRLAPGAHEHYDYNF